MPLPTCLAITGARWRLPPTSQRQRPSARPPDRPAAGRHRCRLGVPHGASKPPTPLGQLERRSRTALSRSVPGALISAYLTIAGLAVTALLEPPPPSSASCSSPHCTSASLRPPSTLSAGASGHHVRGGARSPQGTRPPHDASGSLTTSWPRRCSRSANCVPRLRGGPAAAGLATRIRAAAAFRAASPHPGNCRLGVSVGCRASAEIRSPTRGAKRPRAAPSTSRRPSSTCGRCSSPARSSATSPRTSAADRPPPAPSTSGALRYKWRRDSHSAGRTDLGAAPPGDQPAPRGRPIELVHRTRDGRAAP